MFALIQSAPTRFANRVLAHWPATFSLILAAVLLAFACGGPA